MSSMVRAFCGNVLAGLAVAAGGGGDEAAGFVAEREGEAVDLRLGGEGEGVFGREVEEAADAVGEVGDVGFLEGVFEAVERAGVADLGEGLRRSGADLLGGAVGALQFGEGGLEGGVAALEGVVGVVGEVRGVGLVVGSVGRGEGFGETGEFDLSVLGRQRLDGAGMVHRRLLQRGRGSDSAAGALGAIVPAAAPAGLREPVGRVWSASPKQPARETMPSEIAPDTERRIAPDHRHRNRGAAGAGGRRRRAARWRGDGAVRGAVSQGGDGGPR